MSEPLCDDITHVIFDLDGLLIDTETCYTIGINNVVSRYGKEFKWDLKCQVMGLSPDESARKVIHELQLPMGIDEYHNEVNRAVELAIQNVSFMPGAERLVKHFHRHSIPMAIATGSDRLLFAIKTKNFGDFFTEKYFSHTVLGDDPEVHRRKPHPDPFIACYKRFNCDGLMPHNVLVFEDSPLGITAAISSGMRSVLVPDPNVDRSLFNPTLIIDSLEEFKPQLFNLPEFDD